MHSHQDLLHLLFVEENTIQNSHGIEEQQKYDQIEPDDFIYTSAPPSDQVSIHLQCFLLTRSAVNWLTWPTVSKSSQDSCRLLPQRYKKRSFFVFFFFLANKFDNETKPAKVNYIIDSVYFVYLTYCIRFIFTWPTVGCCTKSLAIVNFQKHSAV